MKVFLGTLLLLGCLQGVIACALLFWSKRQRQANRLLGILILLISLATFKIYADGKGWFDQGFVPLLIGNFVPFFLVMPAGPLIYFYVKSCLDARYILRKSDRLHFLPVILDLVPVLTAYLYVGLLALGQAKTGPGRWGAFIDAYNVYVDIPRWISVTIYVLAAWRLLRSGAGANVTLWVRQFIWGFTIFQGIWLLHLVPYELPATADWLMDHLGWYPLYIPLVTLSYWLGIRGYLLSQSLPLPGASLPDSLLQPTLRTLEHLMKEDKLYRDSNLKLSQLAKRVGLPPKTLSAVLNQHLQKGFNEYVNEYRVREIQGRLQGGDSKDQTIAGLAYEAGFNSLQNFQRAFKSVSGTTPTEFMLNSGIE